MQKARLLAAADEEFAAEHYEKAEFEYQQVLWTPPPEAHALERLGIIYYNQGRWAEAIAYLNKAIDLQPTNAAARIKLGLSELAFQRYVPAGEQALAVLAKEPENMAALLLLVSASYSTQDLAQVTQALGKASSSTRQEPGYHLVCGALFQRQKDLTNAEVEYRKELSIDPKSSQAYLALGNLFLLRHDLKQAESALKSAAELAPLHSGARLSYAGVRLQTGAAAEAIREVQGLVKKAPDYLPAWLFLARAAAAQGRPDDCSVALEKVLAKDPLNLEGLTFKGSLLLGKGDGTNAAAIFEQLINIYPPGPPQAHYYLALADSVNGDLKQAVVSATRALTLQANYPEATLLLANLHLRQGDPSAAIALLTRLVDEHPELAQGYVGLASVLLGQKRYDDAGAVYQRMAQVFTNNPEAPFNLASVLLAQSKTNEARQSFEKSLSISPDFLPAIEQLVQLDLNQDRAATATSRVNALIEKYPKLAALQVLLGRIHIQLAATIVTKANEQWPAGAPLRLVDVPAAADEVQRAEAALRKAIELSPDSAHAYELLASVYLNSNREQQALDCMNRLLARTNDAAGLLQLGVIQEQMKNYASAADTYEKALKAHSNYVPVLNNLAVLYSERSGQPDRAFQLAERARQLQPASPAVADTLGWILFRRGEYAQAVPLLEEAAARLPGLAEVQYHLGMAHYMLGEEAPARAALQIATRARNPFEGAQDAGTALRILAIDPAAAKRADRTLLDQRLREMPADPIAQGRLAAIRQRDRAQPK